MWQVDFHLPHFRFLCPATIPAALTLGFVLYFPSRLLAHLVLAGFVARGKLHLRVLPSSSGSGHRPLTAKIAGSNPVGSTTSI